MPIKQIWGETPEFAFSLVGDKLIAYSVLAFGHTVQLMKSSIL